MNQKIIENMIEKLGLEPKNGSALHSLVVNADDDKSDVNHDKSDIKIINDELGDISESNHKKTFEALKRLQVVRMTKPILELAIQANSHSELSAAKSAGVESLIDISSGAIARLNTLEQNLNASRDNLKDLQEMEVKALIKKFSLAEPPKGLEVSVLFTLFVAAITTLLFVFLSVKDMLDSSEGYWGLFAGGILFLIGLNFCVTIGIRVVKFKKNINTIFAEARRRYLEKEGDKFSNLQKVVEEEAFNIQKREYRKASEKKFNELIKEEGIILATLNSSG